MEGQVRAALRRRGEYPVREAVEDGKPVKQREVLFRGPVAEAIVLLGSSSDAAVTLGARKLAAEQAVAPVAAAIEERLFATKEATRGDFRRLRNLIKVLGALARDTRTAGLETLLERMIDAIA